VVAMSETAAERAQRIANRQVWLDGYAHGCIASDKVKQERIVGWVALYFAIGAIVNSAVIAVIYSGFFE